MLKGFKEFLMRGNIIDLAIAVVIGTAFTNVVTEVTNSLIKPLINAVGGATVPRFGFYINGSKESTFVDLAAIINGVLNFLIIAGVVYFILVVPMKKIQERRARGKEAEDAAPTDVELLTEIRDLLADQQPARGAHSAAPDLPPTS